MNIFSYPTLTYTDSSTPSKIAVTTKNSPTNSLQVLSQHKNAHSIWNALLRSPSHFPTELHPHSGYHFGFSKLASQIDSKSTSLILSEQYSSTQLLSENEHLSAICQTFSIVQDLGVDLDKLSLLGIQKHLCHPDLYNSYMDSMFNIIRLSDIRYDSSISEVLLRQSDRIIFDMNSIRKSDIPGKSTSDFCGFTIEEACQIMRFIGATGSLKTIEICSIDFSNDADSDYYKLVSLLIWYIMDGMTFKLKDSIISHKKQYVVYPEGSDTPLYFYNESSSDKWWVNTSDAMGDLIACSPKDYQCARNGEISDRILKVLEQV